MKPDKLQLLREALAREPGRMTMQLARELDVPEAEVVRALPEGRSVELDPTRWEELIRALEPLGSLTVIVSNGATTIETHGTFGGFSSWGDFFNVQSDTLDMHIRWPELAAVFAVEKPSHADGTKTLSVQFYDRRGAAAFKAFLVFAGKPSPKRLAEFEALKARFRLVAKASAEA